MLMLLYFSKTLISLSLFKDSHSYIATFFSIPAVACYFTVSFFAISLPVYISLLTSRISHRPLPGYIYRQEKSPSTRMPAVYPHHPTPCSPSITPLILPVLHGMTSLILSLKLRNLYTSQVTILLIQMIGHRNININ